MRALRTRTRLTPFDPLALLFTVKTMRFPQAILLLSLLLVNLGADTPKPVRKIGSTPWHLIDTWWEIGKNGPFESYSIDVTISDDVAPQVKLYIAPVGLGRLNDTDFYGGIQTQSDGNTRQDQHLRSIGRGCLFSMWGERSLDAIRPAEGGLLQSSGHEGDFVSVRRPYAWKKGTYTYRLTKMDREIIDGKPYTWVGAFLYSHEKDENIFIGSLRFKGEKLVLGDKVASFVEIYGQPIPLTDIPKLTVKLGNIKVNGQLVQNLKALAVYPQDVPDYADAKVEDNSLVITVGQEVKDRPERTIRLLGGKP